MPGQLSPKRPPRLHVEGAVDKFAEALASGREGLRALREESDLRIRETAERIRSAHARRDAPEAVDAGADARATSLYESATGDLRPAERKRTGHRPAPRESRLTPNVGVRPLARPRQGALATPSELAPTGFGAPFW